GGRGVRVCRNENELVTQFPQAYKEAETFFGKGDLFIEKYIEDPKHIEVQIVADKYGNVIHLGERDCSIQRRHQKIVEVAPSPNLPQEVRQKLLGLSVKAIQKIGYENVGTIEYLVDKYGNFYFIEMNTRLQVEHTITEEITGVDIVELMIRIAEGEPLPFLQHEIIFRGYAIEFRINAEDPKRNFAPAPGKITAYYSPGGPGVRIDGAVYKGYIIPPYYDSMVAKLIVRGRTWDKAVRRARRALEEFIVRGVPTNIPLHKAIVNDPDFVNGNFTTKYLDEKLPQFRLEEKKPVEDKVLAIAAAIAAFHGIGR
ncbi:MAG TPA: acetyl-CoA carboxylase biotin carboxylase subunit, partial [Aquifex aeolicus]|nr:acetyl-CoA carboxylase biotin carboxylase subunit [Aquifex aeolicus]